MPNGRRGKRWRSRAKARKRRISTRRPRQLKRRLTVSKPRGCSRLTYYVKYHAVFIDLVILMTRDVCTVPARVWSDDIRWLRLTHGVCCRNDTLRERSALQPLPNTLGPPKLCPRHSNTPSFGKWWTSRPLVLRGARSESESDPEREFSAGRPRFEYPYSASARCVGLLVCQHVQGTTQHQTSILYLYLVAAHGASFFFVVFSVCRMLLRRRIRRTHYTLFCLLRCAPAQCTDASPAGCLQNEKNVAFCNIQYLRQSCATVVFVLLQRRKH